MNVTMTRSHGILHIMEYTSQISAPSLMCMLCGRGVVVRSGSRSLYRMPAVKVS